MSGLGNLELRKLFTDVFKELLFIFTEILHGGVEAELMQSLAAFSCVIYTFVEKFSRCLIVLK